MLSSNMVILASTQAPPEATVILVLKFCFREHTVYRDTDLFWSFAATNEATRPCCLLGRNLLPTSLEWLGCPPPSLSPWRLLLLSTRHNWKRELKPSQALCPSQRTVVSYSHLSLSLSSKFPSGCLRSKSRQRLACPGSSNIHSQQEASQSCKINKQI